jgi:alkyldihydroxyacetonephosphate synthase
MVVVLDLRRMDRVLELDAVSGTARIQAGVMGPHMEQQLNTQGFTLGHFPDSFLFSTLGGWIATRSAGMQSDRYGKIEDMVVALRMVTPSGTIETRTVPRSSNGIDVSTSASAARARSA